MTINYKNTFDDLIALSTYIFENDRTIQMKIKILQVLFPIYIMFSYLSFAGIYKADMTLFIFFLTLSVFLVILLPFLLKFVHKRQFLRNLNRITDKTNFLVLLSITKNKNKTVIKEIMIASAAPKDPSFGIKSRLIIILITATRL